MARYKNKWAPNPREYMMDKDKPPLVKFLLDLLYAWAEYEPRIFVHKRRVFSLLRGQLVTSHKEISEHLHLNDSRYRQAGRFLEILAKDGQISIEHSKNAVIITCLNYPETIKAMPSKPDTTNGQSFSANTKGDSNSRGVNENNSKEMGSDLGSEFPCPTRETAIGVESHGQSSCPLLRNLIILKNKSNPNTNSSYKTYSVAEGGKPESGNGTSKGDLISKSKMEGAVIIPILSKRPGRVSEDVFRGVGGGNVAKDNGGDTVMGFKGSNLSEAQHIQFAREELARLRSYSDLSAEEIKEIEFNERLIRHIELCTQTQKTPQTQTTQTEKPHESLMRTEASYQAMMSKGKTN